MNKWYAIGPGAGLIAGHVKKRNKRHEELLGALRTSNDIAAAAAADPDTTYVKWVKNPAQDPTPGCGCTGKGIRRHRCAAHGQFVKTYPFGAPPVAEAVTAPPSVMGLDEAAIVLDALGKLAELRDRGIVTPSEFEAKKTELLGRM
jgi:hypothetical protein